MKYAAQFLLCATLLASCSPISRSSLNKAFLETEKKFQDFTGFMVYDMQKNKSVFEYNSSRYFTPASNTKIFTLYAALTVIGDSVPAMKYIERNDSLIFWGTGDPSFLNRNVYNTGDPLRVLRNTDKAIYFATGNFETTHFGSGWAWDDYNDYYSAERSSFPIYSNMMYVDGGAFGIDVSPSYYKKFISHKEGVDERSVVRDLNSNILTVFEPVTERINKEIPAKITPDVIAQLLSDTLAKNIQVVTLPIPKLVNTLLSEPADSLYKEMMQESDNFIAEQLLLVCAGILSDTLKPEIAIDYMMKNHLMDLPDKPVWADGSGLSRYNLFTPRSIVSVWKKIYSKVPRDRLFALLATGGKPGTLKNWYKAENPYIFGKTGSLSNNHCLSGYLVTRSGKTLIFSFMNSNFTVTSSEVRTNMQNILNLFYEKY